MKNSDHQGHKIARMGLGGSQTENAPFEFMHVIKDGFNSFSNLKIMYRINQIFLTDLFYCSCKAFAMRVS
jgi:hypothetical protein